MYELIKLTFVYLYEKERERESKRKNSRIERSTFVINIIRVENRSKLHNPNMVDNNCQFLFLLNICMKLVMIT